jgi:lipid-binding SYLF domain-containing protein
MKKAAFGFGGQGGKGVVACRRENGAWGPPSMLSMAGGSFGLQIGVQSTDVIMLIMNKRGAEFLTSNKFQVGGDLSAAAGPVGRDATANTDAALNAEIYTYSRSRGAFAGISLKGARVTTDDDGNRVIYGRPISARVLLQEGNVAAPAAAAPFLNALNKYAKK